MTFNLYAQEHVGPVRFNPLLKNGKQYPRSAEKITGGSLSLPFFEDFTGYGPIPDPAKWTDSEVYINNTICVRPISRGVATFDDLNKYGLPYDTLSNTAFTYADSLTSQPINLGFGAVTPQDSVYLSFFYQAGGNGFYPLTQDSLLLYFKNVFGDYVKVWSVPGLVPGSSAATVFTQVMIPITDSLYFSDSFQFRFVNIGALNWADAVWNVDYIRLGAYRSIGDTMVNDVAIVADPTFLLNDYTSMPYSQFIANTYGEIAAYVSDSLRNDSTVAQNPTYTFAIYDTTGGAATTLCAPVSNLALIAGYQTVQLADTVNIPSYSTHPPNTVVSFETISYIRSTPFTGDLTNDTIAKRQVFDNYLAYDDGSAEQAYYLSQGGGPDALPDELEIEFHLNHPDTLRGLAIYFARQIPLSDYKVFSIVIYSALAGVNGQPYDVLLRQQDYNVPEYIDTVNHFWVYKLDNPLVLPSGTFYAGTMQPAFSNSDSLYFGFDVNRVGGNHAYFRLDGAGQVWNPSLFNGAIMVRPLIGHDITSSSIRKIAPVAETWQIFPNPANDQVRLRFKGDETAGYRIINMEGLTAQTGTTSSGKLIDISKLPPGVYIIYISNGSIVNTPQKFIKL